MVAAGGVGATVTTAPTPRRALLRPRPHHSRDNGGLVGVAAKLYAVPAALRANSRVTRDCRNVSIAPLPTAYATNSSGVIFIRSRAAFMRPFGSSAIIGPLCSQVREPRAFGRPWRGPCRCPAFQVTRGIRSPASIRTSGQPRPHRIARSARRGHSARPGRSARNRCERRRRELAERARADAARRARVKSEPLLRSPRANGGGDACDWPLRASFWPGIARPSAGMMPDW
jgi:hypothetical protein